ncbi:hypothetical protein NDU88_009008 [Pleurodeles waltl]|uniref:Uncharacterized protein n=1 Tax=Pleurodeles waltl TaxID=8319 RepID=A0AAV7RU19_PLEWA|nr:hypothetical protein NDU88_009008 [Pleurodeles waltl]
MLNIDVGEELEGTCIANPDIRIPVVLKAERLQQPRETERENAEAGERRAERSHDEQRRPEQLTQGRNPDDGQGGPETRGLCHVPGGA